MQRRLLLHPLARVRSLRAPPLLLLLPVSAARAKFRWRATGSALCLRVLEFYTRSFTLARCTFASSPSPTDGVEYDDA